MTKIPKIPTFDEVFTYLKGFLGIGIHIEEDFSIILYVYAMWEKLVIISEHVFANTKEG